MAEKIPEINGLDIAVHFDSASTVGGDFYRVLQCEKGPVGFIIGDVSGKGLVSALFLVRFMKQFEMISLCEDPLSTAMIKANEMVLKETRNGAFITMVFMILNLQTRILQYCNAGHPPPLLWNSFKGRFFWLGEASVPPLGVSPQSSVLKKEIQLEKNDCVVLYTDGLSEARNHDGNIFGPERIEQSVKRGPSKAKDVLSRILSDLETFHIDSAHRDDLTVLAFSLEK